MGERITKQGVHWLLIGELPGGSTGTCIPARGVKMSGNDCEIHVEELIFAKICDRRMEEWQFDEASASDKGLV